VNLVGTEVVGVQREGEIATSAREAVAEPVVEPRIGTIYSISILVGLDMAGVKRKEIAEVLGGLRDDIDDAVELLKNAAVELVDAFCEGEGWVLAFETRNEGVANKFGFSYMLRPDAEEHEPTPWTIAT
jgi:hypothetical protein